MAFGTLGEDEHGAPLAEINTTPLVDVMLVLLVIFLVTAPMLTHAVKLELPTDAAQPMPEEKAITVSIDAHGRYFWNDAPVTQAELERRLAQTAQQNARQPLHLRADSAVDYGKVSFVLAAAQRLGVSNIGFITQPQ